MRLNRDGGYDASFTADIGGVPEVVVVQNDDRILLGGAIYSVNGVRVEDLARLNPDGSLDASFHAQVELGTVYSLVVEDRGPVLVGGSFARTSGLPRAGVARLLADGTLDTAFNPGAGIAGEDAEIRTMILQMHGFGRRTDLIRRLSVGLRSA